MRILIDLQGAQSESRFRGIGRYSLALALAITRNAGEHEIWLALNGALAPSIDDLRATFAGLIPMERIRVFDIPAPTAEIVPANDLRRNVAELLREHFLAQLKPDAILVTSLFEGYIDDAVISVGRLADGAATAVVLYDLIPFLNPANYLGTPEQRAHYDRKIASLKQAGLLLAISDYTRMEAIDALGLAPESVVAISTAVDTSFAPGAPGPALAPLQARLNITRPFLMYAPGGFDTRKNLDGLITAFSLLDPNVRAAHQLVIVSKLGEHERNFFTAHATSRGLRPDEVVLTGYVADTDLIALYRATSLFVFPSKHEGFGLPALEAMSCGAIVIGADNTSIPEVIGCDEAMFDAASPAAIASKINDVLQQPDLRERLRAHGRQQAARFSWDTTARKALLAIERHAAQRAAAAQAPIQRRLAVVTSPGALPLLAPLHSHFDVQLIMPEKEATAGSGLAGYAATGEQILYVCVDAASADTAATLLGHYPGVLFALNVSMLPERAASQDALDGASMHGSMALLAQSTMIVVPSEDVRMQAAERFGVAAVEDWVIDDGATLPRRLEQAHAQQRHARPALVRAIAALPGIGADAQLLAQTAQAIASMPEPMRQRQILVDVSPWCASDAVADAGALRALLMTLVHTLQGRRIETVYLGQDAVGPCYRYARRFMADLLGLPAPEAADAPADIAAGDLLLGEAAQADAALDHYLAQRGVQRIAEPALRDNAAWPSLLARLNVA